MSEGGRLAIHLSLKYPDEVAFVNSVSGPIESFKDNQLFAIEKLLESRNRDPELIKELLEIWDEYYEGVVKREIPSETIDRAIELRNEINDLYIPANTTQLPSRPLAVDVHFGLEETIGNVQCPVLFQYGQEDARVDSKTSISLIPYRPNFPDQKL